MVCMFMVSNNTLEPILAAAAAASQPAWPAPTTIISYCEFNEDGLKIKDVRCKIDWNFCSVFYLSSLVFNLLLDHV